MVVERAVQLARLRNTEELHFLHVSSGSPDEAARKARRDELFAWLGARLAGDVKVPQTVRVVGHEASGDPAHVIVEMASDLLADMVIVGTHGRKGVQRLVMGSVAESVVRNAGCQVLVVRLKLHHELVPRIEPPCPRCVDMRVASHGQTLWCEQHSEKHGRRHTYYDTHLSGWASERLMP